MAKCSRCKGYSRYSGLCDNCVYVDLMERRIKKRKDPNHTESAYAKQFWDEGLKKYNKNKLALSKMKRGFFD